jgi:DNA-binding NarL/FixJ family response regulator
VFPLSELQGAISCTRLSEKRRRKEYVKGPNQLRILIADDHAIARTGLKDLLSTKGGWTVCAEAATGREAVALAEQQRPDIAVMDIVMPDLNGLEATRRIRRFLPKTEVVVLSLYYSYSEELVREVVDAGARAYVLKSDAITNLISAVKALANHQPYFTSSANEVLIEGLRDHHSWTESPLSNHKTLTSREREVVQLLAEGKSSKEVAVALGVSVKAAETHRTNIMRKLEVHSVTELVRYAVKHHMIEP